MDEELKQPTLEIATAANLLDTAGELIAAQHTDLAGATIKWLWALGRPSTFWGRTKVATEEVWHLTGGVDLIIQVNESLWKNLSPAGRAFLVDLFLTSLQKKTGGKTEMEVADGENRQLYQKRTLTMGMLDAEVIARHPAGILEISELNKLDRALREPAQYLLDLQAIRAATEGAAGEEDEDGEDHGDRPEEPPTYYYQTYRVLTGPREDRLVYLEFTDAAKTPASLTGVSIAVDQGPVTSNAVVDKALLAWDRSIGTVRTYRSDLLADLDARQAAALEASAGDGLDREAIEAGGTAVDPDGGAEEPTAIWAGGTSLDPTGGAATEEDEEGIGNVTVTTASNVTRFARTAAR